VGACDGADTGGGGKNGDLGDCKGFASGVTVNVSVRYRASGLTFGGKGPGEFGGCPNAYCGDCIESGCCS